jgi:neutral ceramidase
MGTALVGRLQAGVAEQELVGAVGLRLGAELNVRVATGDRTPLMAKALVLTSGADSLALVTLDLFGLRPDAAAAMRAAVAGRLGLPLEAVMVVCSHTRAAPVTAPVVGWAGVEEAFLESVVRAAPDLVAQAWEARQDASLGAGQACLPHLMHNHRFVSRNMKVITAWLGVPRDEVLAPEGPIDPALTVLVVRDGSGRPLCLVWTCAADNRFSSDDQVSADLPHFVQQGIDERRGAHVPCLYLPGCGGNVSFNYGLEQTAEALASGVMAVTLETPCDPSVRLGSALRRMVLPIRDYSQFWSQADIELKSPGAVAAFAQELELLQAEGARAVPAEVQAWRLGRLGLAAFPGASFVELGERVRAQSPFQTTLVVGNAGGDVGTLITREAFEGGGFEAWPARSARVGPGGGEFVAEQAAGMLASLQTA